MYVILSDLTVLSIKPSFLHISKTPREHSRCKAGIIPQDPTKPLQSEKSNISQN